jgi:hypothetical protein
VSVAGLPFRACSSTERPGLSIYRLEFRRTSFRLPRLSVMKWLLWTGCAAERRAARQRARAAREGVGTLGALVENYFTTGPGSTLRRARKTKQLIKTVFGKLLTVPLLDLKRPTLQLIVDEWPSRHSAALAVRSIRPSLKWAEKREMVQVGMSDLEPPAAVAIATSR